MSNDSTPCRRRQQAAAMKRLYSILRPPIDYKASYANWITKSDQKLSVSSKGLVAFTSSFCLNQAAPSAASYHLYVVDINTPYQPYLLLDSDHHFTIVEWDPSGTKLLACDSRGCVSIYTTKDYLISDWRPYFKQHYSGENFIAALWYHSGIVSTINVANQNIKSSSNHLDYGDKVQQSKFGASLRLFGGRAAEGCIIISRTGLIYSMTLMSDGTVDVVVDSLSPLRSKIEVADISHSPAGTFVVATSSGSINSTISLYQIQLSFRNLTLDDVDAFINNDSKRVQVNCKHFNSFHSNIVAQMLNESDNTASTFEKISHIKFVSKDSPTEMVIEISGQNISLIELWELETKRTNPINTTLMEIKNNNIKDVEMEVDADNCEQQDNPNMTTKQQTLTKSTTTSAKEWTFKGNYITDKDLNCIQVPNFRIFGQNRQLNLILLAYEDSSICCLKKDDLQPIEELRDLLGSDSDHNGHPARLNSSAVRTVGVTGEDVKSPYKVYQQQKQANLGSAQKPANGAEKRLQQRNNILTSVQFSTNQTMMIAIDRLSQLHVVKLPQLITCQDTKDEETYIQYLLEYCLITGNDWWDVMLCAHGSSIESICERFQDAYERQPKHIQKKYSNRQLMIRGSLLRCRNNASDLCKAAECHTLIMLNSIASTLKSMLRSQDQDSPAENLSNFLKTQGTQANFFNYENVISKINEKEFYVETHLIQCLQPLNQWVMDLAVFLASTVPMSARSGQNQQTTPALPGAGLIKNKEALETMRELLIIIKIWGSLNEASLPVIYKFSEQIDVLASLFRIISMSYATLASEADEQLVNECSQLINNVTIPHFEYFLAPIGVASPSQFSAEPQDQSSSQHLELVYFQQPALTELVPFDEVDGDIVPSGKMKMDVVRNISLGAYPISNVRYCTRCNSVSLIKPPMSHVANTNRIWEQRWMATCVCGGNWAQSSHLTLAMGEKIALQLAKVS